VTIAEAAALSRNGETPMGRGLLSGVPKVADLGMVLTSLLTAPGQVLINPGVEGTPVLWRVQVVAPMTDLIEHERVAGDESCGELDEAEAVLELAVKVGIWRGAPVSRAAPEAVSRCFT
jgi:hypothetical protein